MAQGWVADLRGDGATLSAPAAGGDDGGRSVFVIFNPASGRGRGKKRLRVYQKLLGGALPEASHALTTRPGEEAEIADRAIADGFRTIVAVGGDGTWSHVADRIVAAGQEGVRLGILPSGTGNDFARSVGISQQSPEAAVRVLVRGVSRKVDVGRVDTAATRVDLPGSGPRSGRHFLNLVGFGFDIAVIEAARRARFLRGELLYKWTALRELFRFKGIEAVLDGQGGVRVSGRMLMLTISNGRYFGGGFPIAPSATVSDGRLHACVFKDGGPGERFNMFGLAEQGQHARSRKVLLLHGPGYRVRCPAPPRFEVDGDVYLAQDPEVEVEVLPRALEVVMPDEEAEAGV